MYVGRFGKLAWVIMIGVMAISIILIASMDTYKLLNMQPASMSLQENVNTGYIENQVESGKYVISTPVVFTFSDGRTLKSSDSRLNSYEASQLLSGESVDIYYNKQYPIAVFDEEEKPNPILWWGLSIFILIIFVIAIKLWRRDYGTN